MARKVFKHSFAGGEMSPLMLGHVEDEGYRTGWAEGGRNMLALPTGAAAKRPEFGFVRAAKAGIAAPRTFPFVYGDGDAYALECGPDHIRFHAEGETLMYATPIPVASVDLAADTFTTVAAHGLAVNEAVRITHKDTSIPGNLATAATYFVRTTPTTTTFTLSATAGPGALLDLTTNSTIDETQFWRQAELPREYITSKNVASVNAGANTASIVGHGFVAGDGVHFTASLVFTAAVTNICTSVAHGLVANQAVTVSSSGTLPAPLVAGVTYFVSTTNLTADTFSLDFTLGAIGEIDITTTGTGTHTLTPVNALASTPPIVLGTVYYARPTDADNFTLHLTAAEAIANTGIIDLTGIGADTPRCHYAYFAGDVVWGGSVAIDPSTSSRAFWLAIDLPTTAPAALPTIWHQMPRDGVYEVSHVGVPGLTHGAAGLLELNYDQSFDAWTFCSSFGAPYTLNREIAEFPSGSSSTADVFKFAFRVVDPSPGPSPPVLSLSSRVFGENYAISWAAPNPTVIATVSGGGAIPHTLTPGDAVYMEATLGVGDAINGIAGTPGFFLVTNVGVSPNLQDVQFRLINGGAIATNTSGAIRTGFVRVVGSSSRLTESYVVTALLDNKDESIASNVVIVTNNLAVPGSSNVLAWTAVEGATRYRLYKKIDEAYGLILETDLLTATDDGGPGEAGGGIGPDLEFQPPVFDNSISTQFPRAVANFQQRQWFGGLGENERRVMAGKTGTVSTMSYHERTLVDTDRIRFDVAARERTLVRHIVPASQLWVMTSAAEIKLTGQNTDILSPVAGIDARPLSQIGCTGVRPIVAKSNILFVGNKDGHVYELPAQTNQVVDPPDLSIRAPHLFDDFDLVQSAQQSAPTEIEWWPRSDGALLGMTYLPEQGIRGWHVHTVAGTNARVLSACVIPDSDGDRLYALIERTINGSAVVYMERMGRIEQPGDPDDPTDLTDCKFLDSRVTYTGTATTTVAVPHLIGEIVHAVADGVLRGPFTVPASGIVTLPVAASTVHVGLLPSARLPLLPASLLVEGFGKGRKLNLHEATLRVEKSCGFTLAIFDDSDAEFGVPRPPWPAAGVDSTRLRSKDVPVSAEAAWNSGAQIVIADTSPFPLTVVSVTLGIDIGGPT